MTRALSILAIVLVLFAFGASVVSSERYENENRTNENDTVIEPISTNDTEENNVIVPNNETVNNDTPTENNTTTITTITPAKPSHETITEEPVNPLVQENEGVVITAIYPTGCERVVIQNNNNFTAHLEGWELFNACGKLTTFPDIDVKSGKTLTVYAKAGTNTEEAFYLNKTKPIFKDAGGTAYLFCSCGNTTSTFKN